MHGFFITTIDTNCRSPHCILIFSDAEFDLCWEELYDSVPSSAGLPGPFHEQEETLQVERLIINIIFLNSDIFKRVKAPGKSVKEQLQRYEHRLRSCLYECAAVLKKVQEIAAAWQLLTNAQLPRFAQPNYAKQSAQLIRIAELPKNAQLTRNAQLPSVFRWSQSSTQTIVIITVLHICMSKDDEEINRTKKKRVKK
jgi:hypothetical protein